jgi:hypothetical protein
MRPAPTPSLLALVALLAGGAAFAGEDVTVYQLAGTVQCSSDPGVSPDEAADLLRGQGVKVISAQRRKLPLPVPLRCGAPTGEVNLIEVPAADWALFSAQNADGGGYGIWVFEEPSVEIYKYDGTLQCGLGKERSLEAMAEELKAEGVQVIASRKGKDGLDHIAVCGASTGVINVYTVTRETAAIAEQIGFNPLVSRPLADAIKPQTPPGAAPHGLAPLQRLIAPSERTPLLW